MSVCSPTPSTESLYVRFLGPCALRTMHTAAIPNGRGPAEANGAASARHFSLGRAVYARGQLMCVCMIVCVVVFFFFCKPLTTISDSMLASCD